MARLKFQGDVFCLFYNAIVNSPLSYGTCLKDQTANGPSVERFLKINGYTVLLNHGITQCCSPENQIICSSFSFRHCLVFLIGLPHYQQG